MAVAFDAAGAGAAESGSDGAISWSHTSTGSNRVLLVSVAAGKSGLGSYTGLTRSVTCGGVAMPSLGAVDSGGSTSGFGELFYLLNQPSGAQTISVTVGGVSVNTLVGGSVSYTGVGSIGSLVTANPFTGAPSLTVSSATNRRVVAAFISGSSITSPTQTQRFLNNFSTNNSSGNLLFQDAAGASSVTFGAANNSDYWALLGVDLREPSGGGSGTPGMKLWNGTAWADAATRKLWNGANWVDVVEPAFP